MAVFLCRCSAWWFKSLFLVWQQYKTVCIHLLTVRENGNLHDLIPVVSTVMLKRFRRELKIWLYSILVSICWSNSVFILHLFSYLGQRCFGKFAEVWKLLLQEVWSFLKKNICSAIGFLQALHFGRNLLCENKPAVFPIPKQLNTWPCSGLNTLAGLWLTHSLSLAVFHSVNNYLSAKLKPFNFCKWRVSVFR